MNSLASLSVVLLALFASCAGPRAQRQALAPAVVAAWNGASGVEADVEAGIADAEAAGALSSSEATSLRALASELDRALGSKDMAAIRAFDWHRLEPYARRGVQAQVASGAIGPGVAVSLLERIDNVAAALANL